MKNNNLYNDKELFDDADLDWYDYGFRNYDPQIGRFTQLDPLTDEYPELTNYQYASNDPIGNVDVDGLEGVTSTLTKTLTQEVAPKVVSLPGITLVAALPKIAKASSSFFSHVWNVVKVAAKTRWKIAVNSFNSLKGIGHRISTNFNNDVVQAKILANQLNANAKRNWASGNTLIQQVPKDFMENPLAYLEGGGELEALRGIGLDIDVLEETKFSKSNFRKNLIESTEVNPGKLSHAHHVFPQKFINEFEKRGIDIHDPQYGTWWKAVDHLRNAKNYNVRWQQFLNTNPSKQEILDFGKKLMSDYGIRTNF